MKKSKIILVLTICLIFSLTMFVFSACDKDSSAPQQNKTTQENNTVEHLLNYVDISKDILVINDYDSLSELGYGDCYTQSFFDSNALILLRFIHSSTETNISLSYLAIKDNLIYPVFAFDSPGSFTTDDEICTLHSVEIDKATLENYDMGKLLVIDRSHRDSAGVYHKDNFYDYFNGSTYECLNFNYGAILASNP